MNSKSKFLVVWLKKMLCTELLLDGLPGLECCLVQDVQGRGVGGFWLLHSAALQDFGAVG